MRSLLVASHSLWEIRGDEEQRVGVVALKERKERYLTRYNKNTRVFIYVYHLQTVN